MGDLSGIQPPRMNWLATDLPTEFRSFRQYCELIFSGPFAEKGQDRRVGECTIRGTSVKLIRKTLRSFGLNSRL